MTDPFSIVAGAISLIGATLKTSEVAIVFINGIRGAPRAVNALSYDVVNLQQVLKSLQDLLSGRDSHRNATLVNFIPKLKLPLEYCMKALEDLDRELKPYVRLVHNGSGSRWRRTLRTIFLWKYRETKVMSLQRNMVSAQSVLDSAVQVVHLSISTKEFGSVKRLIKDSFDLETVPDSHFEGSDAPQSDYGFAMKRFLLDTASLSHDPPPSTGRTDAGDQPFQIFYDPWMHNPRLSKLPQNRVSLGSFTKSTIKPNNADGLHKMDSVGETVSPTMEDKALFGRPPSGHQHSRRWGMIFDSTWWERNGSNNKSYGVA